MEGDAAIGPRQLCSCRRALCLRLEIKEVAMLSVLRTHVGRFPACLSSPGDGAVSGTESLPRSALPWPHHSRPRSRMAENAAWAAISAPPYARWIASRSRQPRTNTDAAIRSFSASTSPAASSADSCEDACPTYAIQLIPDVEMGEYHRHNLVYEKEQLLIDGPGKYPGYNYLEGLRRRDRRQRKRRSRERGARHRLAQAITLSY